MTTKTDLDRVHSSILDRRTHIAAKLEDAGLHYADAIDWLKEQEQDIMTYMSLFEKWTQEIMDDRYEAVGE